MGTDNFFARQKAKKLERKINSKDPKVNSFLIVTEGEKTEPLYFDGLSKYIENKYGSSIDVKPIITICGKGKCTVSLVNEAAKIRERAPIFYQNAWVVFDKDDFDDFDSAIELARKLDLKVAWSNQSFEYWLYLHFQCSDSALHRDEWLNKLSDEFKKRGINSKGYEKNNKDIFDICTQYGSLRAAVKNAKRIKQVYDGEDREVLPSKQDPSTTVHNLILELEPYISELLKK